MKHIPEFSSADQSRIIEMAWEDRTPFEAIATLYALSPSDVVDCMRRWLAPSSFRLWRQRHHQCDPQPGQRQRGAQKFQRHLRQVQVVYGRPGKRLFY